MIEEPKLKKLSARVPKYFGRFHLDLSYLF
jgi:hypothetical protein